MAQQRDRGMKPMRGHIVVYLKVGLSTLTSTSEVNDAAL